MSDSIDFDFVLEKSTQKQALKPPSLYKVVLNNDDYTPMDFVVEVLKVFFAKDEEAAFQIMMTIHQQGKANCGTYSLDVAETKVQQVNECARDNEHPLLCTMEEV
ncbi:ATP-dependent Clp protease adapter ClpS [Psychrobium sp. 1_MG-2023]|uniref:ATP-dependent Clp protease adapter ClpS n=1 Tax=Psychrobium sp. 1_MG-2023 TaxID=3062624 RepID=UPI000C335AFB|nr:ATP-dependent Clp protease adapter ClpS [Psychrobium sp. 1_MG-2023]MDP2561876.1 ATP-dependent Clp protease adapter ClpS [Psychrobium sp. 1_MG-2023]PKF59709.1 ATP-dependent Clp protease adapter ClpS [Alteromonadales bacterium alter-6D02]